MSSHDPPQQQQKPSVMNRPRPKKRARRSYHPRGAGLWEDVEEVVGKSRRSTKAERDSLASWALAADKYCQDRTSPMPPSSVEADDEDSGWDSGQIISDYESGGEDLFSNSQASVAGESLTSHEDQHPLAQPATACPHNGRRSATPTRSKPAERKSEELTHTRSRCNSAPKTPTAPLCPLPPGLVFPTPPRISRPTSRSSSIASKRSNRSSSAPAPGKRESVRPPVPPKEPVPTLPWTHSRACSAPAFNVAQEGHKRDSAAKNMSRFSLDSDAPAMKTHRSASESGRFGLMRLNLGPQPRTPTVVSPLPSEASGRIKSVHQSRPGSARSSLARPHRSSGKPMPPPVPAPAVATDKSGTESDAEKTSSTPLSALSVVRAPKLDVEKQVREGKRCVSKQMTVFLLVLWLCIGVGVAVGLIVKFVGS